MFVQIVIAGLAFATDDRGLREAFGKYGEVIEGMQTVYFTS